MEEQKRGNCAVEFVFFADAQYQSLSVYLFIYLFIYLFTLYKVGAILVLTNKNQPTN